MKVLFQSRKTLYSAPGGDTTQLLKTKEYLEKLGVEVDISLELEPDLTGYDLVHVFNLMRPQELYLQVRNAKRQHKKVALSTIYGPYAEYEKKARGGYSTENSAKGRGSTCFMDINRCNVKSSEWSMYFCPIRIPRCSGLPKIFS